jgi:hypothetical protein
VAKHIKLFDSEDSNNNQIDVCCVFAMSHEPEDSLGTKNNHFLCNRKLEKKGKNSWCPRRNTAMAGITYRIKLASQLPVWIPNFCRSTA